MATPQLHPLMAVVGAWTDRPLFTCTHCRNHILRILILLPGIGVCLPTELENEAWIEANILPRLSNANSFTPDLMNLWCGWAWIVTHLNFFHLAPHFISFYVIRPWCENLKFYMNLLHHPLLLLLLSLLYSPWRKLIAAPHHLLHQFSKWESRKGLQTPILYLSLALSIFGSIIICRAPIAQSFLVQ